jgi:hypothetical protein
MREQQIQKRILDKLYSEGFYAIKVISANRAGVVDIHACSPTGKYWSIEVKKPGEKPSRLQSWNLDQVTKRGGVAFWCDSYNDFLKQYNDCTIV